MSRHPRSAGPLAEEGGDTEVSGTGGGSSGQEKWRKRHLGNEGDRRFETHSPAPAQPELEDREAYGKRTPRDPNTTDTPLKRNN